MSSNNILNELIQKTDSMSIMIPFVDMPNVSSMLDIEDYTFALTYPKGSFLGFMIVIHMNTKYPQYHNLRHDETSSENMIIFSKNGWEKCLFKNILKQLEREAVECIEYVHNNGNEMLKKIEILKNIKVL